MKLIVSRNTSVRYAGALAQPEMFTYDELLALGDDKEFEPSLAKKLEAITTTPFVSNEAYYRGAKPHLPEIEGLGKSLRVLFWNIERGVTLDNVILLFTDKDAFLEKVQKSRQEEGTDSEAGPATRESTTEQGERRKSVKLGPKAGTEDPYARIDMQKLAREVEVIQSADVIVLNEVDWGMPRSNYREVIVDLGKALNINWVFGVEFVEIDPSVVGTEKFEKVEDEEARKELLEYTKVDKERLRALHGTAILSKYPIREAKLQPFEMRAYDWYKKEQGIRPVDKGFRVGSTLIGSPMAREMRRGGRTVLTAHLDVPHLREKRLTVVSPHLENRTKPKNRQRQMQEVLAAVKPIRNPVIGVCTSLPATPYLVVG